MLQPALSDIDISLQSGAQRAFNEHVAKFTVFVTNFTQNV